VKRILFGVSVLVALAAMVLVFADTAAAMSVMVQNTLDNNVSVCITYVDRSTGLWTTQGWWNVKGNDDREFTIDNVDESKALYYHASQGNTVYADRKSMGAEAIRRWVSNKTFTQDTVNGKPNIPSPYLAEFFRGFYSDGYGGLVIRIDTKPVG
jgi:uncharacterized membrane protein